MRLLLAISLGFVLLNSCQPRKDPENALSLGMPWREAEKLLKDSKSNETQMAVEAETESNQIKTYDLADGTVLLVRIAKKDARVSQLELCLNPAEPKGARTWKTVSDVKLK